MLGEAMTREEVIRMAHEVGILMTSHQHQIEPTKLERFAALVVAAEREACLKMLDENWYKTQSDVAAAIRARGNSGP